MMTENAKGRLTTKDYRDASLERYQESIAETWPELMRRPALYTWLRVVAHATTACEEVRKRAWDVTLRELGDLVNWWLAFIAKLNRLATVPENDNDVVFALPLRPSDIVWLKYPEVCPVEFGLAVGEGNLPTWDNRPADLCQCLARKKENEDRSPEQKELAKTRLREFAIRNSERRPESMAELESCLRRVFSSSVYAIQIDEIAFHLLEEVGEVSQALAQASISHAVTQKDAPSELFETERTIAAQSIAEELADVFSWTVSLVDKLRLQFESLEKYSAVPVPEEGSAEAKTLKQIQELVVFGAQRVNLADIIWRMYGEPFGEFRCRVCKLATCRCDQETQQMLVGKELTTHLETLRKVMGSLGGGMPASE